MNTNKQKMNQNKLKQNERKERENKTLIFELLSLFNYRCYAHSCSGCC